MTFKVTYRTAAGNMTEEVLDAANRSTCLALMKTRGITPLQVNIVKSYHGAASRRLSVKKTVVALSVISLFSGLLYLAFLRFPTNTPTTHSNQPIRQTATTVRQQSKIRSVSSTQITTEEPQRTKPFKAKTKPIKTAEVEPPEIQQEKLLGFYHSINPGLVRDHELFKHDSDIMIADVLTAYPGERLIGLELDRNFDKNFAASLNDPITPHEKDTPDDKQLKDAVMQTRQALAEQMTAGESPAKIIQQARDDLNKIADYRDLLEQELHKMAETEDEESIDDFVTEANKLLDEYGAFHIKLGKRARAKIRERMMSSPTESNASKLQ